VKSTPLILEWHLERASSDYAHTHNIKTNVLKISELTFSTSEYVLVHLSGIDWDQVSMVRVR